MGCAALVAPAEPEQHILVVHRRDASTRRVEQRVGHHPGVDRKLRRELNRLGRDQHGLLSLRQAHRIGITDPMVHNLVLAGTLERCSRGVLAFPAAPRTWRFDVMRAVLSFPRGVVASHETAARLWGFDRVPRPATVMLSSPQVDGIWTTSPAWTIVDLAGRLDAATLEEVVLEACRRRLTTPVEIARALGRRTNAAGAGKLREILRALDPDELPKLMSVLESRFSVLLRRGGVPMPEINRVMDLRDLVAKVDARWTHARVIREIAQALLAA